MAEPEDRSSSLYHARARVVLKNTSLGGTSIGGVENVLPTKSGEIGWRASVHMVALPQGAFNLFPNLHLTHFFG